MRNENQVTILVVIAVVLLAWSSQADAQEYIAPTYHDVSAGATISVQKSEQFAMFQDAKGSPLAYQAPRGVQVWVAERRNAPAVFGVEGELGANNELRAKVRLKVRF